MDDRLEATIKALEGRPLWGRHQAADIEVLKFGARVETTDFRGNHRVVGEWAIHLTGSWRITRPGGVLVGARDWWIAADGVDEDDFKPDVPGQSRRDRFLDRFMAHGERAHRVDRASVSELGDLRLVFSDGCLLETFSDIGFVEPTDLADHECWRIFQPGRDGPHLVVGPGGRVDSVG